MANFNSKSDHVSEVLNAVARNLHNASLESGTAQFFKDSTLAGYLSMESGKLSRAEMSEYQNSMSDIAGMLTGPAAFGDKAFLNAMGLESVQDIPAHSLKAAQIVVAAAGDTRGYAFGDKNVRINPDIPQASMESLYAGDAGALSVAADQSTLALESFDEIELDKFLNYSIIYNVMASRQDAFNAMFFKPLTITQDEIGYVTTVRVEEVYNGHVHDPDGDVRRVAKNKLIDALVHPEILETNSTEIIPFVQSGGSVDNTGHFVDAADVAPAPRYLDNVPVLTAPLKVGEEHNILGLSSHPTLIANELMHEKDTVEAAVKVKKVYLKLNGKVIAFDTDLLHTSGFYRAREGDQNKLALSFDNKSFVAGEISKAIDGTDVPEFKALTAAGYDVRLAVRLNGTMDRAYGNVEISAPKVRVSSIVKDGDLVPSDKKSIAADTTLAPLITALDGIEVIGYDLQCRRTNFNLRSRGLLIDSNEYREQITIPLRSPISIQKPIVGPEKEYPDVKALVSATRIQANNDGVKTILNHARLMEQIMGRSTYNWETDRDSFPGIGRHFFQPFHVRETLDLPNLVNSVSSAQRRQDIQGAITTKLNEIVGRALQATNYRNVVEQLTGGSVGKVKAIIGTDQRLPQYLNIQGDVRLFGDAVDFQVESTSNKHMRDKIVMSFTRTNSDEGPDPFNYGTFVWAPELVVSGKMHRGASTYHQHMVQPRYLHIVNLPIIIEIDVIGIEEVTGEATVLPVNVMPKADVEVKGNNMEPSKKVEDKVPANVKPNTGKQQTQP